MIIKILENGKIKLNSRILKIDDYPEIVKNIKKELRKKD